MTTNTYHLRSEATINDTACVCWVSFTTLEDGRVRIERSVEYTHRGARRTDISSRHTTNVADARCYWSTMRREFGAVPATR